MKNSILAAAAGAAALSFVALAPANAGVVGPMNSPVAAAELGSDIVKVRRGRGLAIGAAAAIITLGVIAASRRSHSRRYHNRRYRYNDYGRTCRKWRRRCNRGNDRACWKFDTRC